MSVAPRARFGLPAIPHGSPISGQAPRRRTVVRLWIPATPILWLLSPIPFVLAPLLYLAPPLARPTNPYAAVLAVGRLLTAASGAVVDVETPDLVLRLRIT
jgi:hypothetical protein